MRFAVLNESLIGYELAVPVYNDNGMIYLNSGVTLNEKFINLIRKLGLNTVYINDSNNEIILQEVLDSSVKLRLAKSLKGEFEKIWKSNVISEFTIQNIIKVILENINLSENAFLYNNVGLNDDLTKHAIHSIDVAVLSIIVGVSMKYDDKKLYNLAVGALLHDIGKLLADKQEQHPEIGYQYIKNYMQLPPTSVISILQHHENNNGTGYPNRLANDKIYEYSKIVSICNAYANIQVTDKMLPHQAIEYITAYTPVMFDPTIYNHFINSIYCYPNGLSVKLSNGYKGVVVMQNKQSPTRPEILVNSDSVTRNVDLLDKNFLTLFIEEVIL
jgi:HD-GYP domain-containing protein (c-di-GMP phosphodiesterase class II)